MQIEFSEEVNKELRKISGGLKNLLSLSINKSIRMVYVLEKKTAYFVDIGTHDQVYKK